MSVLVLNAVGLDPVLQDFLISRLVAEVFKVADTLYVLEGIEVHKLPLALFQQQSTMLGDIQIN